GWRDLGGGRREPGAAIRVLQASEALERYVFGDLRKRNIKSLQEEVASLTAVRAADGLSTPLPEYFVGHARELVARECAWVRADPLRRTVMFLDPFGMQVRWATVEQIAATGRCDLWMLVPTGQALIRCISKKGQPPPEHAAAIDEFFGGPSWRSEFYDERAARGPKGLFDVASSDRESVTAEDLAKFFIERRLKSVFRGGAHPTGLPLYRKGAEAFRLVFACANPSPKAHGLALHFASQFIQRAQTPR
ncbi:three-Cys-motif partner protein TcmP, partial [Nostoc sp. NIES-2111]